MEPDGIDQLKEYLTKPEVDVDFVHATATHAAKKKPVSIVKKQATAKLTVKKIDGTEETVEEAVGKPQFFDSPPCTVSIGARLKIGMPNYSSAECSVSLSVPCSATEIDDVADFAGNWVDKRMADAAEKLNAAKGS